MKTAAYFAQQAADRRRKGADKNDPGGGTEGL